MKYFLPFHIPQGLAQDTFVVTALRSLARGTGFLIPFFIAAWFGISPETDAFFFVYGIVIYLTSVFADILENFIVPYIVELNSKREDVGAFIVTVSLYGLGSLLILCLLTLAFIRPALGVFTKFPPPSVEIIVQLFLEIMPLIIISPVTSVVSGALNACRRFNVPALSPAFRSLVTLAFIYVFKANWGVHAIPLGYALGEIVRLCALVITSQHSRLFRLKFFPRTTEPVKNFLKAVSYQAVGMLAVRFNPVINRAMASGLGDGAVSMLDYADRVYAIPVAFFVQGFLVTVLSHWAVDYYKQPTKAEFNSQVLRMCKTVFGLSLLVSLMVWIFSGTIVGVIYGGKQIDAAQVAAISRLLGFYILGFVPLMVSMTLSNAFIVQKRSVFLMITGLLNCFSNVILNIILMKIMGLAGIALATTIVQFIFMIVFIVWFKNFSPLPRAT